MEPFDRAGFEPTSLKTSPRMTFAVCHVSQSSARLRLIVTPPIRFAEQVFVRNRLSKTIADSVSALLNYYVSFSVN